MAKAKQCDRCKKLYSLEEDTKYRLQKLIPYGYSAMYTKNKTIDLCPECEKSLDEWVKKGEENNE